MTSQRRYTAQRGFFSHDDDPESGDFRATTRVDLGLLARLYPKDDASGREDLTQWQRLQQYIRHQNSSNKDKQYKLLCLIRHGEGPHNGKEKETGRAEWDRYWAKVLGDGIITWADAELTANGERQVRRIAEVRSYIGLRRCLRTVQLALPAEAGNPRPTIKEKLRERLGIHTCDQRSSRSWIAAHYPSFDIEPGFTEEDLLWGPDQRETIEEHAIRSTEVLDDNFNGDYGDYVVLASYSDAIMSVFAATGWKKIPVAAGAVYPLLMCGEKVQTTA
ncbi:hypothetical protein E8E12_001064 [Didymella heteroderae]|uniref:Phosphoglycerate mutase n=1 Tax=Didymella heteroderae TaxID=1769908 RepID=A0A9P4WWQ9_9PLEO|nr:hypothetical protein E8E12_001064 [Didymella heteroderae]